MYGSAPTDDLLEGLNPEQRQAVETVSGPLLIVAGAGSGKTRVLTNRIANLVANHEIAPYEILAITFTNRAAREMVERVARILGNRARHMWVMTFHAACARILRREAELLGYRSSFSIYDQADQVRLVRDVLETELNLDTKRYPPRGIHERISSAKNRHCGPEEFAEEASGFFDETVAKVYAGYQRRLVQTGAMDFDDLLFNTVTLLEDVPDARARWQRRFRHVLVDEYQDTNHTQYRIVRALAAEHGNVCVVGDPDQCVLEGTLITMGDGTERPVEAVRPGDLVLSCHGRASFHPTAVLRVHEGRSAVGIAITTGDGRRLVSTSEHMHFAGYRLGLTPQLATTYLMWKEGYGYRIGTSSVCTRGQKAPAVGFWQRCRQEHGDAAWVIETHTSEMDARLSATILSLRYGIPTQPFVARGEASGRSLVGDQRLIDRLFSESDTSDPGRRLLADSGLSRSFPHYLPQSFEGRRRTVTLTLGGGHATGTRAQHRIAVAGCDSEAAAALRSLGLSLRPAKAGSSSWRFETSAADYATIAGIAETISSRIDVTVRRVARFGALGAGREASASASLPWTPAASVRRGMVMFTADGGYDVVERVERVELNAAVFDLDVERSHNYVANGLITHNSIYSWRGADVRNILDFSKDFEGAEVIRLEQNYRSTQRILDGANGVIDKNRERQPKRLWSSLGDGEPIRVVEASDENAEARYVCGRINAELERGASASEIAVFYRTHAQSRALEDGLRRVDIPYRVVGGSRFYDRAEIKDALAYLQVVANPSDDVAARRILNSPRRGIGTSSEQRLAELAQGLELTFREALRLAPEVLSSAPAKRAAEFSDLIDQWQLYGDSEGVGGLLDRILDDSGYRDTLREERTVEARGRLENLEELLGVAREYDLRASIEAEPTRDLETAAEVPPDLEEPLAPGLAAFLQELSLQTSADEADDDRGQATLMTIHNAKGLEFPTVFMVGMEDNVFPHIRALEEQNVEEERRLCYVGMTRAERSLTMVYCRERTLYGRSSANPPSMFLAELPAGLVEHERLAGRRLQTYGAGAIEAARARAGAASLVSGQHPAVTVGIKRREDVPQLATGDSVRHRAWGEGVVIAVASAEEVVVRFAEQGEKRLHVAYAPIEKL